MTRRNTDATMYSVSCRPNMINDRTFKDCDRTAVEYNRAGWVRPRDLCKNCKRQQPPERALDMSRKNVCIICGVTLINKESAPVAWAGLMYELDDAQEHLAALIFEMDTADDFDETDLRIRLAHVFSHLNRAWHRRDRANGLNEEEWLEASRFPSDLDPM